MTQRQKRATTQPQQQQAQPFIPQGQYPLQRLFQPQQQTYRSVQMSSANASEASNNTSKVVDATQKINEGKLVAEIDNNLEKKPYMRLLNGINVPFNPVKNQQPSPPSFAEAIGDIEYKTQEEKDEIERIRIDYEMNLTSENQKKREKSARRKISKLKQGKLLITESGNIEINRPTKITEEEPESELLSENQLVMKKMYERKGINMKTNFTDTPRDFKLEKQLENYEKKNRASNLKMQKEEADKITKDAQKAFEEFIALYTEDELIKLGIEKE